MGDRTTKAKIRDAAFELYADQGEAGTTARAVAAAAGVSPALVIHHFGSMDGLRAACDRHVATTIREAKQKIAGGTGLDPLAALREANEQPPLEKYLVRAFTENSPGVSDLFDEMVEDALRYMNTMVEAGMLKPTGYPRGRAVVLTAWTLGALAMHQHVERLLGVDLLGQAGDPAAMGDYLGPLVEILSTGVFTEETASQIRSAFVETAETDGKDQM